MSRCSVVQTLRSHQAAIVFLAFIMAAPALAHETQEKVEDPGFRPESENASAFIEAFDTATIAVYPSIIRKVDRVAYSYTSRQQIISSLNEDGKAGAVIANSRIDMGALQGQSQWNWFQNGIEAVSREVQRKARDVDYSMTMEILFPPGNQYVFGVHLYILDRNGENAFSFLMNSHHRSFVDANMVVEDSSEAAYTRVIEKATHLGLAALQAQIEQARECIGRTDLRSVVMSPGIFDDFEFELPAGTNESGVPLGFSTFSDGKSAVSISTSTSYPPRPGDDAANSVLKLDLDVTDWAGFAHTFENDRLNKWKSYDWSALSEFSFWLYGRNSGTSLFVDILDNRNRCSTVDDAERFTYEFTDDFAGWRRIAIRFTDMRRKEIYNNAPDDGFTLSQVHGWAFGALNTGGEVTYYIDHVGVSPAPASKADYPTNELPMYGHLAKTAAQKRADKKYISYMTRHFDSRAEAADSAAKAGWDFYYKGDRTTAIKRFNQAWLLDPENQLALWGFAGICQDRGQLDEAIKYFEMALRHGPANAMLERDYRNALLAVEHRQQAATR